MFKSLKKAVTEFSKGTLATIGMAFGVVAMEFLKAGEYELAISMGAISAAFFGLFAYLVEKQAQA